MSQEPATLTVKLRKSGDLIIDDDGKEIVVAHYDRASGHLEFTTKEYSVKLYNQCTAKIGTVANGTQPSGMIVKSIGVKGQARAEPKGKRPRMGKEGDGTPTVVDWYIRENPTEAIARYGIFTDKDGKMVRKTVERVVESIHDGRNEADDPVPTPVKGQSFDGGPIKRERRVIKVRNAIIARRPTRYEDDPDVLDQLGVDKLEALFSPNEVVGGWQPEDGDDDMSATPPQEDAQ